MSTARPNGAVAPSLDQRDTSEKEWGGGLTGRAALCLVAEGQSAASPLYAN